MKIAAMSARSSEAINSRHNSFLVRPALPGFGSLASTNNILDRPQLVGNWCRQRQGASHLGDLGAFGLPNISVRIIARITKQLTTPAQSTVLPLNFTLYHPRPKAAIAAIKTKIVHRRIVINRQSIRSQPIMPNRGLSDYEWAIQIEALPSINYLRVDSSESVFADGARGKILCAGWGFHPRTVSNATNPAT
jgi:hypothetical protein